MKTLLAAAAVALALTSAAHAKPKHHFSPVGVWASDATTCAAPDAFLTYHRLQTPMGAIFAVKSIPMRGDGAYEVHLANGAVVVFAEMSATHAFMVTPWGDMHGYDLTRC